MAEKPVLVILHGGDSYDTETEYEAALAESRIRFFEDKTSWKTTLFRELSHFYEVLIPTFPKKDDAKYDEWKFVFEKFAPALDAKATVYVGHSLGGIFLAKYLAENPDFAFGSAHLIAAPFLPCGSFRLPSDLKNLAARSKKLTFWHAENDPVVDYSELERYRCALPDANFRTFENRFHFNGERFDELAEELLKSVAA